MSLFLYPLFSFSSDDLLPKQEGATKEDIEQLSKFKFRKMGDNEKLGGDVQGLPGGIMTECGTDSSMEHVLSQEDAVCSCKHSFSGLAFFIFSLYVLVIACTVSKK